MVNLSGLGALGAGFSKGYLGGQDTQADLEKKKLAAQMAAIQLQRAREQQQTDAFLGQIAPYAGGQPPVGPLPPPQQTPPPPLAPPAAAPPPQPPSTPLPAPPPGVGNYGPALPTPASAPISAQPLPPPGGGAPGPVSTMPGSPIFGAPSTAPSPSPAPPDADGGAGAPTLRDAQPQSDPTATVTPQNTDQMAAMYDRMMKQSSPFAIAQQLKEAADAKGIHADPGVIWAATERMMKLSQSDNALQKAYMMAYINRAFPTANAELSASVRRDEGFANRSVRRDEGFANRTAAAARLKTQEGGRNRRAQVVNDRVKARQTQIDQAKTTTTSRVAVQKLFGEVQADLRQLRQINVGPPPPTDSDGKPNPDFQTWQTLTAQSAELAAKLRGFVGQ